MIINDRDCSNKKIIIENFNTFFAIIIEKNKHNIHTHEGSHIRHYLNNDVKCNFLFYLIDDNATLRIIIILKFQLVKGMVASLQSL